MKTAQDLINDSGYPLQIRLEKWIKETQEQHQWRVSVKEHRWVNSETKEDGYIDLVLEHSRINLKLVVECKRIAGSWTFLLPTMNPNNELKVRILHADYKTFKYTWNEFGLSPETYEAAYCVMEVEGKKDSRTLEKLTSELLLSLECLAVEETDLIKSLQGKQNTTFVSFSQQAMFYLPIIVTTATLQKLIFDPSNVDVKSGKISSSQTCPVEFMRFRKNLATKLKYEKPLLYTLRDLNRENDRTVFVVQAESFINFLNKIEVW
jgi:hypothetical protein